MAKYWNPTIEKMSVAGGMVVAGYHIVSQAFTQLPALPEMITNNLMMGVSLLTVAGGLTLYGVYVLYAKY